MKQCLEEITKEHIKKDFRIEERKVIEKTWVIAEVVIDWDLWGPAASSEAKIIGRVEHFVLHEKRVFSIILKISRTTMEHVVSKDSSYYKLQIQSTCSIGTISILEVM